MSAFWTDSDRTCTASILRVVFLRSDIDLDELKPWFILCNFIEPSLGIICACGPVIQGLVSSYRKSSCDASYQDSGTFQSMKSYLDEQPLVPSNHHSEPAWTGTPSYDRTMAFTAPRDSIADPNGNQYRLSGSTCSTPAYRHRIDCYSNDEEKAEFPFETTRLKTVEFFDGRPNNNNREFALRGSLADWVDQVASQRFNRHSIPSWPLPTAGSYNHSEAAEAVTKPAEALSF